MTRTCCDCANTFNATGKNYRCNTCRRIYDKAWRGRHLANGTPVKTGKMPLSYHREYNKKYFQSVDNRLRRNENMKKYRNGPLRDNHKARWLVNRALAKGDLKKQPCQICGAKIVQTHHDDYKKPLDIMWLCAAHHRMVHAKAEGRPCPQS